MSCAYFTNQNYEYTAYYKTLNKINVSFDKTFNLEGLNKKKNVAF